MLSSSVIEQVKIDELPSLARSEKTAYGLGKALLGVDWNRVEGWPHGDMRRKYGYVHVVQNVKPLRLFQFLFARLELLIFRSQLSLCFSGCRGDGWLLLNGIVASQKDKQDEAGNPSSDEYGSFGFVKRHGEGPQLLTESLLHVVLPLRNLLLHRMHLLVREGRLIWM